jgi:uncharacterized hydrophobic protein (TIGR00271 family)
MTLRVYTTTALSPAVVEVLKGHEGVGNLAVMEGASKQPEGDLIIADIAREAANGVIRDLKGLGVHHEGAIQIGQLQTWLSRRDFEAERLAPGEGADAVVWPDIVQRSYEDSTFTIVFAAMLTLAVLIAQLGIILDSLLLIVGAMVVGPEFGPVAAIAVGLVRGHRSLIQRAIATLLKGFTLAIAIGTLFAVALRLAGWADGEALRHAETSFIYNPDKWSVLIAVLAGITGVVALTSAKSSALVGVFISVTTVPAAANAALAVAFAEWSEVAGSVSQLLLNLAGIGLAGWCTLEIQQFIWRRSARARGTSSDSSSPKPLRWRPRAV